MRRRLLIACAACAVALLGSSVLAQARGQARQRQANMPVAQVPVALLDSNCKLSPAQKQKIQDIQTKLTEDLKALRPARGAQPDPGAAQKRRDLTQAAVTEINNVLTPEQREAIRQTMPLLQALRTATIPLPVVADLKLTDEQKKQMLQIVADVREKLRGLPAAERRAKMREGMADARKKLEDLLTEDQKAVIKKYREQNRDRARRNRP